MITRRHSADGIKSVAIYSPCEGYRYSLTRTWDENLPRLLYIMLNPSKATEQKNDPTIERCQRRAVHLGYGGFRACNIFAWRETSPEALKRASSPVGTENALVLSESVDWADTVLCAWGVHGGHQDQAARTVQALVGIGADLHVLGLSKEGHPRHPLYVPYSAALIPWNPDRAS